MRQNFNNLRRQQISRRLATVSTLALACALQTALTSHAHAQQTTDLGTAQTFGGSPQAINTAPYQAPTQTPLTATQPVSVISKQFIENNTPPTDNFDRVVGIAPSVMTIPGGSGGDDAKIVIRGFTNGQYNITLDGIPLRAFNLTQRSGTFVMTNDLGQVIVDRGPGTASTMGDATYGGTIAMQTKSPLSTVTATPTVGYGSFATQLYGAELDSGPIAQLNGASFVGDVQYNTSDGYYTNDGKMRTNVFFKAQQPLGANTVLTLVEIFDDETRNYFQGASLAQIAKYGPNFGLTNTPNSQMYAGYNVWDLKTDFEYIGFKSDFGDGWHVDNKLYMYGYDGFDEPLLFAKDPSGLTPNGTKFGANDVAGQENPAGYRSFGDTLAVSKDTFFGDIKAGVWAEYQPGYRALYNVDMTQNAQYISTTYAQHLWLSTVQPYFEVDVKPLKDLTITAGVKDANVWRNFNSTVDPNTGGPLVYGQYWQKLLPSVVANYKLLPDWSVYAQAAEGFLTPPYNLPTSSNVQPQTTWSYQTGSVWRNDRVTLSGDLYYINSYNTIVNETVGGIQYYFNAGGANYKGIEAEGTVYVAYGISLYGNASLNRSTNTLTGLWMPETPNETAAGGVIYNQNGWYASLIDKWIGKRYGDVNQLQPLDPFNELDFSLAYKFENPVPGVRSITTRLMVTNILDSREVIDFIEYSGSTKTPLFMTQVGRSVYASVSMPF